MTANAAIVNTLNGVGLFATQAPHFGTKETGKVVLYYPNWPLASTLGSDRGQLLSIRYPRGVYVCDEPTGHWV